MIEIRTTPIRTKSVHRVFLKRLNPAFWIFLFFLLDFNKDWLKVYLYIFGDGIGSLRWKVRRKNLVRGGIVTNNINNLYCTPLFGTVSRTCNRIIRGIRNVQFYNSLCFSLFQLFRYLRVEWVVSRKVKGNLENK